MPRKVKHVLSISEVAAELGLSVGSVRTTMNREGYREVRGYLRAEVDAVKRKRGQGPSLSCEGDNEEML